MTLEKLKKLTNEELAERFPFMIVYNYEGNIVYDDNKAPLLFFEHWGWRDIQLALAEHILPIYNSFDDDKKKNFQMITLKEKFGSMRTMFSFESSAIAQWVNLAEYISSYTCIKCGKIETKTEYIEGSDYVEVGIKRHFYKESRGWICPYCKDCAKKFDNQEYDDKTASLNYNYDHWEPYGPKLHVQIDVEQFWKLEDDA